MVGEDADDQPRVDENSGEFGQKEYDLRLSGASSVGDNVRAEGVGGKVGGSSPENEGCAATGKVVGKLLGDEKTPRLTPEQQLECMFYDYVETQLISRFS